MSWRFFETKISQSEPRKEAMFFSHPLGAMDLKPMKVKTWVLKLN